MIELRLSHDQCQKLNSFENSRILPEFRENLKTLTSAMWSCWGKNFQELNTLKDSEQLTLYINITQSHNLSYTCMTRSKNGISEYQNNDERDSDFNSAFSN